MAADADLLLQAAALARGPQQAVDRLRDASIADEHPQVRLWAIACLNRNGSRSWLFP